jgi:hypothetical protein
MNGIDLAILRRAMHPNCRIALSSGHPETSELLAASDHTFEIVTKPAQPEELLALAAELGRAK